MHKRDLAILALSCFAIYFSLQARDAQRALGTARS
jgi:hypothetical protein